MYACGLMCSKFVARVSGQILANHTRWYTIADAHTSDKPQGLPHTVPKIL